MILYVYTVFAKVHLGYVDGVRRAYAHHPQPLYGKLASERVQGMLVLHLWPYDFPLNARSSDTGTQPLATLWRPEVSCVLEIEVAFSGLERCVSGREVRWMAQRWLCEPTTYASCAASTSVQTRGSPLKQP
jgi:hypothetical protein